ncbi:cadherin-like protein 26 [Austrofundulus limnaeus]|uniref:Cadherin-like protein 26 n=1 Tax=Austrofundulus limnaeus TaxID=52670 RepID=A0A2I4BE31_AUSLI|nr:PREDICTED: cadherin-like protein 26 [Austrofundulus limnaeus]
MGIIFLFLLVALAAVGESHGKQGHLLRSKRRWVLSTIELEEEMKVTYPYKISTMYNDKTEGKAYEFVISGDGVDEGLFSIDKKSGDVFVHQPIDREKKSTYHITFDVLNPETGQGLDKNLAFDVDIKDINDNPPRFVNLKQKAAVMENAEEGYLAASIEAVDFDQENTINSTVKINVTKQEPSSPQIVAHQIDDRMARLKFKGCFDYSKANMYKIHVMAYDLGKPPLNSTAVINLFVIDKNSHQPTFKQREYQVNAMEMTTYDDLMRVSVEDKDTPNTNGWRAKYYFISGNEEGIYSIKTDPKTNEGVLSIVKEKNFAVTTLVNLKIGVENIEPLTICKDNKLIKEPKNLPPQDSVNITVTMNDTNDAPEFEKYSDDVYQTEESEPGQVLYKPIVKDIDSPTFRFILVDDPAHWVSIDEKTGEIKTIQKMDRESPFVDEDNVYKIVIAAIDDGVPAATSTCTVKVHLRDINDNTPTLVNKTMIMCGNRVNKIMVPVRDADAEPFSGPFSFNLEKDETVNQRWKLEPAHGEVCGLVSRTTLPYGNYSVPLVIEDKQNMIGHQTLEVILCDCDDGDVCRKEMPLTTNMSGAGIGLIVAGLLLFLLLLLAIGCWAGKKTFKYMENDEGNQTLIKYNQEGGGATCMAEPPLLLTPTTDINVTDGIKQGFVQQTELAPGMFSTVDTYNSVHNIYNMQTTSLGQQRGSRRSYEGPSRSASWNSNRRQTVQKSIYKHSMSSWSDNRRLGGQINQRVYTINEDDPSFMEYNPVIYGYEGEGSRCQSLDQLSINNQDDDLHFLDDLGPKFKNLGEISKNSQNIQM